MPNLEKNTTTTSQNLPPMQTEFNPYQATLTAQLAPPSVQETNLINYNHITYALYVVSFFTAGLLAIVPIVMNYLKRNEARGTWLESHFDWQIKTFWYGLFFGIIAIVLLFFGFSGFFLGLLFGNNNTAGGSVLLGIVGLILTGVLFVWHVYRLARGWIALTNRRAVP